MISLKNLSTFCLLLFSQISFASEPVIRSEPGKGIQIYVNNVCGYFATITVSDGDDLQGTPAVLGIIPCNPLPRQYYRVDTLDQIYKIKYFDIEDNYSSYFDLKSFCLGDDHKLVKYRFAYNQSQFCDSIDIRSDAVLLSDSMLAVKTYYDGVVVIKQSASTHNLLIYDSTLTIILASFQLNMLPEFVGGFGDLVSILGRDIAGSWRISTLNYRTQSLIADTLWNNLLFNPVSVKMYGSDLAIADEPGDSILRIIKYNPHTSSLRDTVIYTASGMNTHTWINGKLHFQPKRDSLSLGLDSKVLVFDVINFQFWATYPINKRLSFMYFPGDEVGYNQFVYLQDDSGRTGKHYLYNHFNYFLSDSGATIPHTVLYQADFRCPPFGVNEYDDEQIVWKIFPNPASEIIQLNANGLICGRKYKIDVTDIKGSVLYEGNIHAKMTFVLPVEDFEKGIYFIRIHTRKGFVVQKFIKI